MDSMILWGRSSAFNVQKVLWFLGELGLKVQREEVGGVHGGLDTPEFLQLNPHGRVPVLRDGSLVIWESHAILRYLAARHGEGVYWSSDPGDRSQVDRWMDWSQCSLQPAFMRLFWGYYRTPPQARDERKLRSALEECDRLFAILDRQLATSPFLAGGEFSLADVPTGTALYRYFEMGLDVPRHAHVEAWYARLRARNPYRAAVMLPFEELRGRTEY